jgi:hypothetical protein
MNKSRTTGHLIALAILLALSTISIVGGFHNALGWNTALGHVAGVLSITFGALLAFATLTAEGAN